MKPMWNIYELMPVLLLVLQTMVFLILTLTLLRYLKLLQLPYAGMESSRLVRAAAILLAVMLISFCDMRAVVQTVQTFHSYGDGFYRNTLIKFSQFMGILLVAESFFGILCFIVLRILPGFRQSAADEDMPGAVLHAIVTLIIAVLIYCCTTAIIEPITPRYINFN